MYQVLLSPGPNAMPKSPYSKLNNSDISKIALWIKQGARNTTGCIATCDTTTAKYATDIQPLMNTYCASANCHGGSSPAAAIDLSNYAGVLAAAQSGGLVGSVKFDSNNTGFSNMPKNGTKLSDCNISLITKWVREGAQNN